MSLADGRRVTVYMPAARRARSRQRYPVLVLHDGQNLFEPDRAFVAGQHWRVGETADALIAARRIPPIIICGIDHTGPGRIREMTPTPGPDRTGGQAAKYAALVVDDVLTLVRREFPASREREQTGLGGSSLGGLVSLFAAITYPAAFGRLMMMSPSVWWDRRVILDLVPRHPRAFAATRIWLDVGRKEGARTVGDARRLARALARLEMPPHLQYPVLEYLEDPAGTHSEASWSARLAQALVFLFGD